MRTCFLCCPSGSLSTGGVQIVLICSLLHPGVLGSWVSVCLWDERSSLAALPAWASWGLVEANACHTGFLQGFCCSGRASIAGGRYLWFADVGQDCSGHPRLLWCCVGLWEACWGEHQAGRGTGWQTLLWLFAGDHVPCAALPFAALLLTWVWLFSHIWPFSLWLNYLMHIAEVARSRVGEILPWQGVGRSGLLPMLSFLLGLWQGMFHLSVKTRSPPLGSPCYN